MNIEVTRVALYVRVSTEDQAEQGFSIPAQLENLRAHCRQSGKLVVEEYVDEGISGKAMTGRRQLQRLLADAQARKFDEVLVWKTNRLARNQRDLLYMVDTLERCGVAFRSATEPFETATPAGRLLFGLLGSIGEFERNTIVENVKMGMNQRAKGGQWNGGRVLGYASVSEAADREETVLVVVPEEAAIVRHIFELYAGGKGLKAITTQLNREGYKTKTRNAFSPQAVGLILDNPIYIGKIRYGSHRDWSSKRRRGKTEPLVADGRHEPIVSPELWAQVEVLRKRKSTRPSRTFYGQYLLTGLMRCPTCGATMVASRTKNRLKDGSFVIRRYYVCGNHRNKGATVCGAHGVNADTIEAAVMARIRAAVERPKVLRDVVRRINDRRQRRLEPMRRELEAVQKALEKIDVRKRKYLSLYEEDAIDRGELVTRIEELKAERASLERRKAEIEGELRLCSDGPIPYDVVRQALGQFSRLLNSTSSEQRKALLQLFIKEIVLTKDRKVEQIEIRFDENVEAHLAEEAPSAATGTEGASPRFRAERRGRIPYFTITL